MKNVLTKHRHGREQDRGEQHIPDNHDLDEEEAEDYEEIVPPGTKAFPAVATSPTKVSEPIKAGKPERGPNTSHGHEALPHHARPLERLFLVNNLEYEQFRVNIERDRGLEEGMAAQVLVGCRIISPKSRFPPEKLVEKLEQHSYCEEERKM
ncbi:hypothetical protein Bca52824_026291 [Brassica carinata]|uniref:LTI65/LTI78 N-terminal domain-containing protein n=1 Tax=Brassica carinata TaxID=52824 RepID=A0A8X7SHP3_BRACI|nr:hypothetical protein Bca52824_026291 [Brassica carinata]